MSRADDHPLLAAVGARVRAARLRKGSTVREAAEAAGLSVRFWSDLEAGRANIALTRLDAAARAVGARASELLEGAEEARRVVALLGLRGAGKSTVGRELARRLGVAFVELDERIEDEAGLSLSEIFSLHGEEYHRRLSLRCLADLLGTEGAAVVALPGGIVHDPEAFDLVRRRCATAWLRARPEEHFARVLAQGDRRPMAGRPDAMEELRSLLASRAPLYGLADVAVETSERTIDETVGALQERLAPLVDRSLTTV